MENETRVWEDRKVAAVLPEYEEGHGDCTVVYLQDGKRIVVDVKLRTFLKWLAGHHCKTLPLMRRWAAQYTDRRNGTPLAMGADLVLLPFRARKPRVSGDETLGCVNMECLTAIYERKTDGLVVLQLRDGREIPTGWSLRTLLQHAREARLMQLELKRQRLKDVWGMLQDNSRDFTLG